MHSFIETNNGKKISYKSSLVNTEHIAVLGNKLALKIVSELVKEPACAMDVARLLGENEQKIYYHLKKLENAGIVKLHTMERRYGMMAKIYELVNPVIATKLHENGYVLDKDKKTTISPEVEEFFHPFIENGKLNAIVIAGSPYPHGKYGATARDGIIISELAFLFGKIINDINSAKICLDTAVREKDLKENLIVLGSPKINTISDALNGHLPVFFDPEKSFAIVSKVTNKKYDFDHNAVITKAKNPFNKEKEVLLIAGKRSAGLKTAAIAFKKHFNEVVKGNVNNKNIMLKIITGIDKEGDGTIDSIEFLE